MTRSISTISIKDAESTDNSNDNDSSSVITNTTGKKRRKRGKKPLTQRGEDMKSKKIKIEKAMKIAEKRIQESSVKYKERLSKQKSRTAINISLETPNERQSRLEDMKVRTANNRDNESLEQKAIRKEKDRIYQKEKKDKESEPEKIQRLQLEKEKRFNKRFVVATHNLASYDPHLQIEPNYMGEFDQICPYCTALYNINEVNTSGRYSTCCDLGKIKIPVLNRYHKTMIELVDGDLNDPNDIIRNHFLENIRQYNSLTAFAGIKTNFDYQNYDNNRNRKPFLYKCHGAMYFNVPPMFNDKNSKFCAQTAQFHIMDSTTANLQRTKAWKNDNGDINKRVIF